MEKVIVKFSIDEDGIVELLKIGEYEQYDETMGCGDLFFSYKDFFEQILDLVDLYYCEELYGDVDIILEQVA